MPRRVDWDALLDIRAVRDELGVSQKELAALLGVSIRSVQATEQGWRGPSPALQKTLLLLLLAHRRGANFPKEVCWSVVRCPPARRDECVAYRSRQGHLCWLVAGNRCRGQLVRDWKQKKDVCGRCPFFRQLARR